MANPQKENGFTPIANELVEAYQQLHLSGNQWQIIWTIIRLTYGWNKKVDAISLSMFEKCTGIDRRNLKRNLDILVQRRIISRDGSGYIKKYGMNKDYESWQTGAKNNTSVKNNTITSVDFAPQTSVKNNTHKRQKTIKYSPNSFEVRMAEFFFTLIQKRNPGHKKPDMQKWALHIDRMRRLDCRSEGDIEEVVRWCQADDFWQTVILSTEKLREQFDTLTMKRMSVYKQSEQGVVL